MTIEEIANKIASNIELRFEPEFDETDFTDSFYYESTDLYVDGTYTISSSLQIDYSDEDPRRQYTYGFINFSIDEINSDYRDNYIEEDRYRLGLELDILLDSNAKSIVEN